MATQKMYDACMKHNMEIGLRDFRTGSQKPNLVFLFGKEELVSELDFEKCSEGEKLRHLEQDAILRTFYIELNPNFKHTVKSTKMIAHAQNV